MAHCHLSHLQVLRDRWMYCYLHTIVGTVHVLLYCELITTIGQCDATLCVMPRPTWFILDQQKLTPMNFTL